MPASAWLSSIATTLVGKKQALETFMASLLRQLVEYQVTTSKSMAEMYNRRFENGQQRPTLSELTAAFNLKHTPSPKFISSWTR